MIDSDGRGFGLQQLLADSTEIFISHEKNLNVTRCGPISTKHSNLFDSRTESVSQEW